MADLYCLYCSGAHRGGDCPDAPDDGVTIRVPVLMLAFGQPGEVRVVRVPRAEWDAAADDLEQDGEVARGDGRRCELAFHYGQNDFQPQEHPSVSVGDAIVLPAEMKDGNLVVRGRYYVDPFGFTPIPDDESPIWKRDGGLGRYNVFFRNPPLSTPPRSDRPHARARGEKP